MFDWDNANADHIALHRVTVDEVEEALLDTRQIGMAVRNVGDERRWGTLAATEDGRVLVIVFTRREGAIRVVTARDASSAERRRYRR